MICMRVCVSRSDSDSEGENPEKKKLQEQLMGKEVNACAKQAFTYCLMVTFIFVDNCFVLLIVA